MKEQTRLSISCHFSVVKVPSTKRAAFYPHRFSLSRGWGDKFTDVMSFDIGASDCKTIALCFWRGSVSLCFERFAFRRNRHQPTGLPIICSSVFLSRVFRDQFWLFAWFRSAVCFWPFFTAGGIIFVCRGLSRVFRSQFLVFFSATFSLAFFSQLEAGELYAVSFFRQGFLKTNFYLIFLEVFARDLSDNFLSQPAGGIICIQKIESRV